MFQVLSMYHQVFSHVVMKTALSIQHYNEYCTSYWSILDKVYNPSGSSLALSLQAKTYILLIVSRWTQSRRFPTPPSKVVVEFDRAEAWDQHLAGQAQNDLLVDWERLYDLVQW